MKQLKLSFAVLTVIVIGAIFFVTCNNNQSDYGTLVLTLPGSSGARAAGDPIPAETARSWTYRVECTGAGSVSQTFSYGSSVSLSLAEGSWSVKVTVLNEGKEIGSQTEQVYITGGRQTVLPMRIAVDRGGGSPSQPPSSTGGFIFASSWNEIPWDKYGLSVVSNNVYGTVLDPMEHLSKMNPLAEALQDLIDSYYEFLQSYGESYANEMLSYMGYDSIEELVAAIQELSESYMLLMTQEFLYEFGFAATGYVIFLDSDNSKYELFTSQIESAGYKYVGGASEKERSYINTAYNCSIDVELDADGVLSIYLTESDSTYLDYVSGEGLPNAAILAEFGISGFNPTNATNISYSVYAGILVIYFNGNSDTYYNVKSFIDSYGWYPTVGYNSATGEGFDYYMESMFSDNIMAALTVSDNSSYYVLVIY